MTKKKIVPVILAGGSGTRLWPVSREDLPKQFCNIGDGLSLFQQTVLRVQDTEMFALPVIVTGERYGELVQRQLDAIGCAAASIINEPMGRDTSAAILLAVERGKDDPNSLMLVMPSDHLIADEAEFIQAIQNAAPAADRDGLIVTFGIKPTYPETGFGYLRAGAPLFNSHVCELETFIEKPNTKKAEQLLQDSSVFWNAGIFLFDKEMVRQEFANLAPKLFGSVYKSVVSGRANGVFFTPDVYAFEQTPSISFDYAIMEKTERKATIAMNPQWSDMGSWKAVWESAQHDEDQNFVGENCYAVETRDSLLRSDGPVVATAGVEDIIVVASKDAVLVTSRSNPQGVKQLVQNMKADTIAAASVHNGEDRPWGRFDSMDRGDNHQVKRIRVDPGQRLSLQYHHHRAEHWVVVTGTATVTVDEQVVDLEVGEQIFVPKGAVHRLENLTETPVEIIEVQIGSYLGEDDIVRVEDIYGRDAIPTNSSKIAA